MLTVKVLGDVSPAIQIRWLGADPEGDDPHPPLVKKDYTSFAIEVRLFPTDDDGKEEEGPTAKARLLARHDCSC